MSAAKPFFEFQYNAMVEIPELSDYEEFTSISPQLVSFILRFYDFSLRSSKDDYKARMDLLCSDLCLGPEEELIVKGKIGASPKALHEYSRAVVRFLRMQDNRKWALYTAFEDQFWQNIESIRIPLSPDLEDDKKERAIETRAKNREHTSVLREKLEALDTELWPDPEEISAVSARNDIDMMTPEKMAAIMRNKGGKP